MKDFTKILQAKGVLKKAGTPGNVDNRSSGGVFGSSMKAVQPAINSSSSPKTESSTPAKTGGFFGVSKNILVEAFRRKTKLSS